MLQLIPNEKKDGIQMLFTCFFTHEKQFLTAFDLLEARRIGEDLISLIEEIKKERKKIMAKTLKPKGKLVSGKKYSEVDEEYDKKQVKKLSKGMKTAGISKEMQEAKKEQGYSKKPRVKPQKKIMKPVGGKKKAY